MREGSLEAPTRHPIAWQNDDFYDPVAIDAELRFIGVELFAIES